MLELGLPYFMLRTRVSKFRLGQVMVGVMVTLRLCQVGFGLGFIGSGLGLCQAMFWPKVRSGQVSMGQGSGFSYGQVILVQTLGQVMFALGLRLGQVRLGYVSRQGCGQFRIGLGGVRIYQDQYQGQVRLCYIMLRAVARIRSCQVKLALGYDWLRIKLGQVRLSYGSGYG